MTSGGLFDTDVSAFRNIDEEEERQVYNKTGTNSLRASDESMSKIGDKQQTATP